MTPPVKVIEGYVHNGRVGVLVEVALDTSFTADLPEFKQLVKDLALQVAAVPAATVEALMVQAFVKDGALTVGDLLANASRHLGERIVVTRFVRWDTEPPLSPEPPRAPAVAVRSRKAT